ncbi:hypothetical protein MCOR25_004184 [Pyricularia grisea]|nr:hypothetical protein MCOR25_004184 [Pyricularia grisea]
MQYSSILSTSMAIFSLFSVAAATNTDPFKVTLPDILYRVDETNSRQVLKDQGIMRSNVLFTSDLQAARNAASKVKISSTGEPVLSAWVYYIKTAGIETKFNFVRGVGNSAIKEFQSKDKIPLTHIIKAEAIATNGAVTPRKRNGYAFAWMQLKEERG